MYKRLIRVFYPYITVFSALLLYGLSAYALDRPDALSQLASHKDRPVNKLGLSHEQRRWLDAHPVIRLGVDPNWPPYEFMDHSGKLQGFSIDILKLLQKRLGIRFEVVKQDTWSETLGQVKSHKIDMLSAVIKTYARSDYLLFTSPYLTPLSAIFTHKDNFVKYNLEDLLGHRVVVERNYFLHELLTKQYPGIELVTVNSTLEALKAVSYRQVDAYIGNLGAANWISEKNAINNLTYSSEESLGETRLRMAVRKDWPILQQILNQAIADISGAELAAIRRKWLGTGANAAKLVLTRAERQWLQQHQQIRFAGDPNWLPYEAFSANGTYLGIVADHLHVIAEKLDLNIEYVVTKTWSETLEKVKQGAVDVLSETNNSELNSLLVFTKPYISSPVVIVMRDSEAYVENIEQIQHRNIAVIKEYGYVPEILQNYPDIHFSRVDTIQDGLTSVSTGKIDALLATLAQASYHMAEQGMNNLRIVGKTEFRTRLAFGMSRQYAPLVPLFNRALASMDKAEKQLILNKWGKQRYKEKVDIKSIAMVGGSALIIIMIIIYWNRKLTLEVNKRIASETEAKRLHQRLALASQVVSLGVWERENDQDHSIIFDDTMSSIYGLPKNTRLAFEQWLEMVHPEDHAGILQCLNALEHKGGQQHLEFRIIRSDKSIRHIYAGVTRVQDPIDDREKLFGVNWDITERKQAEVQFKFIIDALPLAIVIADRNGTILMDNPQAIKEIGNQKSLIGRSTLEFYADLDERNRILETLQQQGSLRGRQVQYLIEPDKFIDCLLSIMPISYHGQSVWLAVVINLTDRVRHEKALADAKEAAEAATRAKSAFLANMSHEIRTPMNAILGFTELLHEQVQDPKLLAFTKIIQTAGNNLLALINDILDLSKIEAGKLEIQKSNCNPHDLFAELGNIFMMNIREKQLEFILEIDPLIPQNIQIDAIRLRQVLFNLIGNAVKFTEQGHIRLSARPINKDVIRSQLDLVIDVEDTGIGISADQQQVIFQDFVQSNSQNISKYGGTGLGLSISKRLLDMMGGEISLFSTVGKGSRFRVTLNAVHISAIAEDKTLLPVQTTSVMSFLPAQILVVDDVPDNRELLMALLEDSKLQVMQAENGLQAVAISKQYAFDLILMDIRMPLLDGYQAAKQIKAFSDVPILALTASVLSDEAGKLTEPLFQGVLKKPVLKNDLMNEMRRFLPIVGESLSKNNANVASALNLSSAELAMLPDLLGALKALLSSSKSAANSNNINEIQRFAQSLQKVEKQYSLVVVTEFTEQLLNHLKSFDIQGIMLAMQQYPELIQQLQQSLEQQQNQQVS